MASPFKKPPQYASDTARAYLDQLSKAALIDVCWCLAQLGTDDSADQIVAKLAREVSIVAIGRGDRLPPETHTYAAIPIDSDPS